MSIDYSVDELHDIIYPLQTLTALWTTLSCEPNDEKSKEVLIKGLVRARNNIEELLYKLTDGEAI